MKVALINPGSSAALKKENLGLAYLAGALEAQGHNVRVVDEVAGQDALTALDGFAPDVAGISFMTMYAPRAYAIADALRRRGVAVVLGGAHPSALPEEALEHGDCVIRGEGEVTFPRLLDSGRIQGVVEAKLPDDLDALPMPRRDKLDLEFYAASGDQLCGYSYRTLGVITSRGCPFHCTFCINSTAETNLRYHSPERVLEEIRELVHRYRIESIAFYDELIATDPKRLMAICEGMLSQGLAHLRWECQMHPRMVRPDVLALMKRAGCLQVGLGFESGSQRVLNAINKNTIVESNYEAARKVREAGLKLRGCFVVGVPGETPEDIAATERFIQNAQIDFASIHFLTPMPGTLLFEQMRDEIMAAGIPWDRFTAGNPDTFVCNRAMPADEQKRLFLKLSARQAFRNYSWREMIRRAIKNPRQALHVAKKLIT